MVTSPPRQTQSVNVRCDPYSIPPWLLNSGLSKPLFPHRCDNFGKQRRARRSNFLQTSQPGTHFFKTLHCASVLYLRWRQKKDLPGASKLWHYWAVEFLVSLCCQLLAASSGVDKWSLIVAVRGTGSQKDPKLGFYCQLGTLKRRVSLEKTERETVEVR